MEVIIFSFVAISAIAAYQFVELLLDGAERPADCRADDYLLYRLERVVPKAKRVEVQQAFDEAA
jgi:hypothetical protein